MSASALTEIAPGIPRFVNNCGLLVLPRAHLPNPRIHGFKRLACQLAHDWQKRYRSIPVLINSFVKAPRFTGTVQKASSRTHVGSAWDRGR